MELGFGIIPKLVMKDKRLTVYAKVIYSYFCSYAGAGTTAFPKVAQVVNDLGISRDTFNKHMKLLKQYGYIKVEQQRNERGVYARNLYTLCEIIEEQDKGDSELQPRQVSPCTAPPSAVISVTADTDTNNNNIYKNNNINNNSTLKNNSLKSQSVSLNTKTKKENLVYTNHDITKHSTKKIQDNIAHKSYLGEVNYCIRNNVVDGIDETKNKLALINEMVEIMLDTILSKGTLKINGEEKSREIVKNIFLKLNQNHIEYAYMQFNNSKVKIKNKKGYIRSILFNSFHEARADIVNFGNTHMLTD